MSVISFKTSVVMLSVSSPVPTYSSIVSPLMASVTTLKETTTQKFVEAKMKLANYSGVITEEIQAARDLIDSFDMSELMKFELPSIPGLPVPIFPDFSSITMEITEMAQAIQQFQLMETLMAMIKPMVSFIGGALAGFLPKDPIFGLTPLDILSMSGADLYNMVYSKFKDLQTQAVAIAMAAKEKAEAIGEAAIAAAEAKIAQAQAAYNAAKSIVEGFMSKISSILPTPIFPGISALQMEAMEIVKAIKTFVLNLGLNIVFGLINSVLGKLKMSAFALFPIKIPTLAELKQMILSAALSMLPSEIPYVDEIQALIALSKSGLSLSDLLSAVSIPGFPKISLPNPLLPSISCLAIEIQKACQVMLSDFIASIMGKLVDFVKSTLGMLGIAFSLIQLPFPIITVEINLPELPELPAIPQVPKIP